MSPPGQSDGQAVTTPQEAATGSGRSAPDDDGEEKLAGAALNRHADDNVTAMVMVQPIPEAAAEVPRHARRSEEQGGEGGHLHWHGVERSDEEMGQS